MKYLMFASVASSWRSSCGKKSSSEAPSQCENGAGTLGRPEFVATRIYRVVASPRPDLRPRLRVGAF